MDSVVSTRVKRAPSILFGLALGCAGVACVSCASSDTPGEGASPSASTGAPSPAVTASPSQPAPTPLGPASTTGSPAPTVSDSSAPAPTPPVNPTPTGAQPLDPSGPSPAEPVEPTEPQPTEPQPSATAPSPEPTAPEMNGPDETDAGSQPSPTPSQEPTAMMPSDGPPNPSGWPEPGPGGMARPAGEPGELEVLDWAGFNAAVSYTFDDSNTSQIQNFQAMMDLAVPFTFYMQTGKTEAGNAVWGQALAAGHEIGNHTKSHQSSGNLGPDTDEAQQFIEDTWQTTPYTMAAPNGSDEYVPVARDRFLINRGVAGTQIAPNSEHDPFNLGSYVSGNSNAVTWSVSNFNNLLDQSRNAGSWHIICMHGFPGSNDGAYGPVNLQDFVDAVEYAKSFGDVWIGTVENIGAYWLAQKALSSATPTESAEGRTWNWTLPDNFPPGKYLRVRVAGGTLLQDGQALPWNEHGFYELALDVGTVTLAQ